EFHLGGRLGHVSLEDFMHLADMALARGDAAGLGRAELAQVHIADAGVVQAADDGGLRFLLVADGRELHGFSLPAPRLYGVALRRSHERPSWQSGRHRAADPDAPPADP